MTTNDTHISIEPTLSQAVLSDLVVWHACLRAGGDVPIPPQFAYARCIEALADARVTSLAAFEFAIELLEQGCGDVALAFLRMQAEIFRDACPENGGVS